MGALSAQFLSDNRILLWKLTMEYPQKHLSF
jgi:hypothetical protein